MKHAPSEPPVRWAVAGLGHIAQVAVLPAFAHAKRQARLVALLSDDPKKRRLLARRHHVEHVGDYDDAAAIFDAAEVDAVYVALPNHLHCAFVTRALAAGIHVLCEKPMAVTVAECERMIAAARANSRRLMIDLTFTASFASSPISEMRIIGTEGDLRVENAFDYTESIRHVLTRGERTERQTFARRDQFAAELVYFSACTRNEREPEPSGREGLADVRIIEALYESADSGRPVRLPPYTLRERPSLRQAIRRPPVTRPPREIHARSPSAD